jgi:RimJ/RimL family protein N-acetyltransferase
MGLRHRICHGEGHDRSRIISIRHVDNDASRRVMDKLGMTFERETVVPANGQPVAVRVITRAEYEAGAALC